MTRVIKHGTNFIWLDRDWYTEDQLLYNDQVEIRLTSNAIKEDNFYKYTYEVIKPDNGLPILLVPGEVLFDSNLGQNINLYDLRVKNEKVQIWDSTRTGKIEYDWNAREIKREHELRKEIMTAKDEKIRNIKVQLELKRKEEELLKRVEAKKKAKLKIGEVIDWDADQEWVIVKYGSKYVLRILINGNIKNVQADSIEEAKDMISSFYPVYWNEDDFVTLDTGMTVKSILV